MAGRRTGTLRYGESPSPAELYETANSLWKRIRETRGADSEAIAEVLESFSLAYAIAETRQPRKGFLWRSVYLLRAPETMLDDDTELWTTDGENTPFKGVRESLEHRTGDLMTIGLKNGGIAVYADHEVSGRLPDTKLVTI